MNRISIGVPLLLLSLLWINGCDKEKEASAQTGGGGGAPVVVQTVVQRDVPVQIRTIANVEAFTTVTIKARVSGALDKVHVVAGQDVKAGDLLFEIDPRPFEAAVHEAEARFERDTALASNDQIDAERVARLVQDNAATREEADKARYRAESSKATVRGDQAMLDNARLQLEYTKIRSPVDARAGWVMTDRGNIVKFDETQLLVLNQIKPINVSFNIPEQDLERVQRFNQSEPPAVEVIVPPDTSISETGKLSFIDNQVDNDTGTIRLKATFPNEDRRLWPGQFVQSILKLTVEPNMIVVPSRAVQTGQQGIFVYVLKDDLTVEMRPVKVRRAMGEETVIESGLSASERVVTEGQLRLVPGSKVSLREAAATQPATRAGAS